ncbi:MAG: hypothetical protein WCV84_03105 [Patescibacteria group bacterium]
MSEDAFKKFGSFAELEEHAWSLGLRQIPRLKARPRSLLQWALAVFSLSGWRAYVVLLGTVSVAASVGTLLALYLPRFSGRDIPLMLLPIALSALFCGPLAWALDHRRILEKERSRCICRIQEYQQRVWDAQLLDRARQVFGLWRKECRKWHKRAAMDYTLIQRVSKCEVAPKIVGAETAKMLIQQAEQRFEGYLAAITSERNALHRFMHEWVLAPSAEREAEIVARSNQLVEAMDTLRKAWLPAQSLGSLQSTDTLELCVTLEEAAAVYQKGVDSWTEHARNLLQAIPEHPPWITHEQGSTSPYRGEVTGVRVALVDEAPATVVEDDDLDGDASAQAASTTLTHNAG